MQEEVGWVRSPESTVVSLLPDYQSGPQSGSTSTPEYPGVRELDVTGRTTTSLCRDEKQGSGPGGTEGGPCWMTEDPWTETFRS